MKLMTSTYTHIFHFPELSKSVNNVKNTTQLDMGSESTQRTQ
jgi:hypothetical protein